MYTSPGAGVTLRGLGGAHARATPIRLLLSPRQPLASEIHPSAFELNFLLRLEQIEQDSSADNLQATDGFQSQHISQITTGEDVSLPAHGCGDDEIVIWITGYGFDMQRVNHNADCSYSVDEPARDVCG